MMPALPWVAVCMLAEMAGLGGWADCGPQDGPLLRRASVHDGSWLRRDDVPFVGKVLADGPGLPAQFSCVLAGNDRRSCVTTAHGFLSGDGELVDDLRVTVEIEACGAVYAASGVEVATTRIDEATEFHRERDVAVITLEAPACAAVVPVSLLPAQGSTFAFRWLLPGAEARLPVTIPAYYLGCVVYPEETADTETCEQYSSTGFIDRLSYIGGEPVYETWSIGTLPGSSGAPGLIVDTGADPASRADDTYYLICLNVGHRPGGQNACIALETGSFARRFLEERIDFGG